MSNVEQFVQISPKMLRPRLPRLGNVKIGHKGQERTASGGRKYRLPAKLDHFLVTKRARDGKDNFIVDTEIHKRIGEEKPVELAVRFLFNEPEQNFQTSLTAYDGQKRRCQGNGERANDRVDGEIQCPCPLLKQFEGEWKGKPRPSGVVCKPYGVLSVLLDAASSYGGFHVFRTTSWETISNITASLRLFREQFGGLAFIPFKLVLYPATDTYQDGNQTKTSTSYKVAVVLRADMDTAFQIAATARDSRQAALQLGSGVDYTPEAHAEQLREIAAEDEQEDAEEFFSGDPVVEAEVEDDDPHPLEAVCRRAMELAGAEPTKANQLITEYTDRETELAEKIEKKYPDQWKQALEESQAAAAEPEDLGEMAGDDLDLFGAASA